jgi:Zn-dependent alcohol dehydrogenase
MPFIAGNTPVFNDKTEDESIITSPIYEQVINWLDEKHKIRICLSTAKTSGKYRYDIIQFIEDKWQGDYNLSSFYTSTERNIKAINEAFELI